MAPDENAPDAAAPDASAPPRPQKRGGGVLKKVAIGFAGAFGLLVLYLVAWPSPIDPLPFEPPEPIAMEGALAPNEALRAAQVIAVGEVAGPEDVEIDEQGRIYGGCVDGRIVRVGAGGKVETFATVEGGRPLGLDFGADGFLYVADGRKGLLRVSSAGEVEVLSAEADGVPFKFTDDVDVAADGRVYFSDASHRWGVDEYLYDLLEGRPYGRLLRWDPATKKTEVLADGLYFANGVAIAPDQSHVLITETYRHRVSRYWLTGEEAGTIEVVMDGVPGYPDGISTSPRGTYWLALFTVRNATAETLAPSPFLKKVLSRLPKPFWPKPEPYGFVVELDADGDVLRSFQDPGGEVIYNVTSIEERDGKLYLGSLYDDRIGVYDLAR